MKFNLILILLTVSIWLSFDSCTTNQNSNESLNNTIIIVNIDTMKFINYYTCEFKSNNNLKGYLLIKRIKNKQMSIDRIISKKIHVDDLCDVVEFQLDDSEITFRGHATNSKIYNDGKLVIDLSEELEQKYYRICNTD